MTLMQLFDVLVRRQRRVFVLVGLAVFLCASAVTLSLPKEYKGVSTLFVGENRDLSAGASAVQLDDYLARTYAVLLTTPTLQRQVASKLPGVTPAALDSGVSVEVVPGTRLLQISALDRSAATAQKIANTYAQVFVEAQQQQLTTTSRGRLERLNRRIGQLARSIDELGEPSPDTAARRAQLENELESQRQTFRTVQESTAQQGSNVSVSSLAVRPEAPAKPRTKIYLLLGLIFAVLLGAAAALVRHSFDRRVRDEHELSELLGGLPILARIPEGRSERDPRAIGEAFNFLRVNLRLTTAGSASRVIAITSALPGDGKSTVCVRLARSFAQQGARIIAADCDLRKPVLATYMDAHSGEGVTNVLVTGRSPGDLLIESDVRGVRVLPSGPVPPNPSVLLGLPRFGQMVEDLRAEADYVLIDTPPVSVGVDTSTISQVADCIVLVVDLNRSDRQKLRAAYEQLETAHAPVIGIVLNRVADRVLSYGYDGEYGGTVLPHEDTVATSSAPPAATRAR